MNKTRLLLLLTIAALIALFFAFDLQQYLNLEALKHRQAEFDAWYRAHPLTTPALFFAAYVLVTALSLPGAAVMTLAAGALFGLGTGVVLVSFASSLGATLAFLVSRYLFHDAVQSRFGHTLQSVNRGIERDGAFYLFTLRLVPLFPFFIINLVMGLTPLRAWTFYWVSQVGMLAGTLVYVNAGTRLGEIEGLAGILSPELIGSFALLGLFPLLARRLLDGVQQRRSLKGFRRPRHFDYNLVAIGAGAGGLVTSYIGATVMARVALIEKHRMGGDCLNTGCVPSKALIRSAQAAREMRDTAKLGIAPAEPEVDFAALFESVQGVIEKVEPHDSVERYRGLGVDCIAGEARIVSPWEIEVDGRVISSRNIVIATGARPSVPSIPGLDEVPYLTSDSLWQLRQDPGRLLVLGGGPIGCELGQAFARLGAEVTLVQRRDQLLPREDLDAAAIVEQSLRQDGVRVLKEHSAIRFERRDNARVLICQTPGGQTELAFDTLLLALGRTPNTEGLGLEQLGLTTDSRGAPLVDAHLRTSIPTVYAAGDVVGHYQFTHTAAHQAWYAAVNALFGAVKRFRVDYSVIPWCTFTAPELARVGLNEKEAAERGIAHEVTRFELGELDRAITDRHERGFVKVLTPPGSDRILGATIVGAHAGDLLAEYVLAMKHGLGLNKILGTIHVYPTLSEASKYAAGEWKRNHKPERLLRWLKRYHDWRR
ncbi:pyridine nucleotide-disulfide oxidoreductase [Marinobacterium nitratireducens]|uniref:Pyridine nucleotide-disulfide oxidoreductase n=1 Tax=Marinobacterium nitratireducens TaxID=518897 RepID=A0A918DSC1_9GAMM|nr:FAD-dependent oxidoreductase [Marinobacterium nitratireducens]GGO82032.1 pyridine nucleotide-disulfide oxidoreductase [Marinobacterium nitratireducens]